MSVEDPSPPSSPAGSDRDARAARAIARYLDRLNSGERIEPEEVLAENPELGVTILQGLERFVDLDLGASTAAAPRILGDYTLVRQLGRGGMGVVYEAWQGSMQRQVALKVLPQAVAFDTQAVARFIQEAQLAGKLSHPNIVQVHGMGVEQQVPYFSMEFVDGHTLTEVMAKVKDAEFETETVFGRKGRPGYFERVAEAFAAVADGLQHAHSKRVIHRDIKPSNLILDGEGRLRILDFGLARLEGQEGLTLSGDLLGTPLYMSPEQARRKKVPVDHRTDLYSLGATIYELLASAPPFQGRDHHETLSQIIERDPIPPIRIDHRVPRDLDTIVLKCLAKEPSDRYGTAEALSQDLRRFVRGEVIEARPLPAWERTGRRLWSARRRIASGLVIAALLAVVLWQLVAIRGEARTRLERRYEALVLEGALRLELAPLAQKTRASESLFQVPSPEDAGSTKKREVPAQALRALEEAVRLLPGRPDARYHQARALLYLGREAEALAVIDGLLLVRPPFFPAWTLKGQILSAAGGVEAAKEVIAEAERLAGDDWGRDWIAVWRHLRAGDHVKVMEAETALLERNAAGREPFLGYGLIARLGRGAAAIEAKDYAQALRDFNLAGSQVPGAIEPAILEGKAWALLGHAEEAARVFAATHARAANRDDAALAVSYVYRELKRDPEVLEWTDRLEDLALRELRRMTVFYDQGRWDEAIEAGRKALTHDPESLEVHFSLGFVLAQQSRYSEAEAVLEEGLRKWPQSLRLSYMMSYCLHAADKFAQGIPFAEKVAKEANPLQGKAWMILGMCQVCLGRLEEGRASFSASLRYEPRLAMIHENAGYVFNMVGRFPEALAHLQRALELKPSSYGYENLGYALYRMGRLDEALTALRRGQVTYPWQRYPFLGAAMVLEAKGKPAEALGELITLLERVPTQAEGLGHFEKLVRDHRRELPAEALRRSIAVLESAVGRAPESAAVWAAMAWTRVAAGGEPDRARAAAAALAGLAARDAPRASLASLSAALAETLPGAPLEAVLAAARSVPSYRSLDALAAGAPDSAFLEAVRARLAGADDAASARGRLRYLEALALVNAGSTAEAVDLLSGLAASERDAPEPSLLLAVVLRARGEPERAESTLRAALEAGPSRDRRLWDAWLRLGFIERGRGAADLLAKLPAPPAGPREPEGRQQRDSPRGVTPPEPDHHDSVRWLLERLAAGEALRIRCGSDEDYTDPAGRTWSRDRFCLAEVLSHFRVLDLEERKIARSDASPLLRTPRELPIQDAGEPSGYAFPVPPGRYRVRLLFAETCFTVPGLRRFDITVEGETTAEGFDPAEGGVLTATERSFEKEVADGLLEIRFRHRLDNPIVSAIEIERVSLPR